MLGITSQFWPRAAELLGHPEWIDDPRFATEADRQANEDALNALVGAAMLAADAMEWERRLVAGIPGAKVRGIREGFAHPHVTMRDMLVGFDHPVGSRLRVAGNPVKLSDHPFAGFRPAPGLGADSRRVTEVLLGRDTASLEALRGDRSLWWPREGMVYRRPSVV